MDEDRFITTHQQRFFPSASGASLARRAVRETQGDTEVPGSKGTFTSRGQRQISLCKYPQQLSEVIPIRLVAKKPAAGEGGN